jgi:hypothetical protein
MTPTKTSTFVAAAVGLGLLAGCVSRTTTVRERERVSQPRVVEERTVVVPEEPPVHEETTTIKKHREYSEED